MRKIFTLGFLFIFISLNSNADTWTSKANFGGTGRSAATGFFLNGKGYIGTGWNFSTRKKDFWEWDPSTNIWTQKADLAVTQGRLACVSFAIGNYGYICAGVDVSKKKDLWRYDPSTNSWTQMTDLGGVARQYGVGFELDGYGYVGTGVGSGNLKDFWQYDPVSNSWAQKADFGGTARSSATGFSCNGKGYLGTGYGAGPLSDFWEYDPAANTWTQKANFGGGNRSDATSFSICDKGYIGTGVSASTDKNDLWEYDPANNTWTQKTNFGGSGREDPVGFSDGTYGYIGTGTNIFNEFTDFWQYTPDCIVLPIQLTTFTAIQNDAEILIQWTTESELNNKFFSVEKSLDGSHFETIAVVNGKGNSTSALNYEVADRVPFSGLNYYRLKQTDYNGSFQYSNIVSCLATGISMMRVLGVNPNPIQSTARIETDLTESENLYVKIFNERGQSVYSAVYAVDEGIQYLDLNLSGLTSDVYVLKVECEYGMYSQKIIKL